MIYTFKNSSTVYNEIEEYIKKITNNYTAKITIDDKINNRLIVWVTNHDTNIINLQNKIILLEPSEIFYIISRITHKNSLYLRIEAILVSNDKI